MAYNLQFSYLCCLFRIKLLVIKVISLKCEVLGWYTKTSHFKPNYFNYRQDGCEAAIAGIKIYTGQKISIFAPQVRLVPPIHVKFGTAEGHQGPPARAVFRHQCPGWERAP